MKKLYLVRHAKSSWEFDLEDHERPLNERGLNDAKLIGLGLREKLDSVDKIVSSDALRAQTTAAIITEQLDKKYHKFDLESRLYDFTGDQVVWYIKSTSTTVNTLLLFGHNHAFTLIANKYGNKFIENVPTAGVVGIKFDITDWKDISAGETFLTLFPKSLR
ncbi:histidine phosphatase family protein [Aquimarina sp. ERC-38]|uniref:SixA phosphatase family protein n=1 Tax=Aquimarina sp. ERC-38 TaxID=2949996 RepID=UPI002247E3F6|nr:histidine phosphatase family protein [Aquimarina sp. ERC-38]UZO80258.1 histidine phosphatase family protein [Aquimarina sp. ERC-38]